MGGPSPREAFMAATGPVWCHGDAGKNHTPTTKMAPSGIGSTRRGQKDVFRFELG